MSIEARPPHTKR